MAETLSTSRRESFSPFFRRGPLSVLPEIEDLLERFWGEDGNAWRKQLLAPPLDMSETESTISLRMDLPGVSPQEIDVRVSGNQLTVSGERKEQKEEKGETFHRIERRSGQFSRSVTLPCEVQEDKIDAKYNDGVLSITLPKNGKTQPRQIEVKS